MATFIASTACTHCSKSFDLLVCPKHACAACGQGFCRDCSNNYLVITKTDLVMFGAWEAIKTPQKPQRCCDACTHRILLQKNPTIEEKLLLDRNIHTRYKFGVKLGEGGFAVVKEASSVLDGSKVAVKIIRRDNLEEEDVKSIYQEVKVLESINHPNIVHIYDFYEEPDYFYMVLECINGGELFDRIVEKVVYNEKEARDLVVILLNAIKFCHDRNIVHR